MKNYLVNLIAEQINWNGFEGCETLDDIREVINDWIKERERTGYPMEFEFEDLVNEASRQLNIIS